MCVCRVPLFPRDAARVAAARVSDRRSSYVFVLSVVSVRLMTKCSSDVALALLGERTLEWTCRVVKGSVCPN